MSRGPGKWQRRILAALEKRPAVHMRDLLPPTSSRSHHQALNRAALRLSANGKISIGRGGLSHSLLTLARHDTPAQLVRDVPRLSVE